MNKYLSGLILGTAALLSNVSYAAESYMVKNGDSLWVVAEKYKPEGAVTPQVILAIYEHNPSAFRYANLNSLLRGAELQIPSDHEILSTPKAIANETLDQHYSVWKQGVREKTASKKSSVRGASLEMQLKAVNAEIAEAQKEITSALKDLESSMKVLEKNNYAEANQ